MEKSVDAIVANEYGKIDGLKTQAKKQTKIRNIFIFCVVIFSLGFVVAAFLPKDAEGNIQPFVVTVETVMLLALILSIVFLVVFSKKKKNSDKEIKRIEEEINAITQKEMDIKKRALEIEAEKQKNEKLKAEALQKAEKPAIAEPEIVKEKQQSNEIKIKLSSNGMDETEIKLKKIKDLYNSGLISEEEYNSQKEKLLKSI